MAVLAQDLEQVAEEDQHAIVERPDQQVVVAVDPHLHNLRQLVSHHNGLGQQAAVELDLVHMAAHIRQLELDVEGACCDGGSCQDVHTCLRPLAECMGRLACLLGLLQLVPHDELRRPRQLVLRISR